LIDASASLDAADRALLNLWVNRGLADAALAEMTGMTPEAIASRRAGITQRLGEQLGLPAHEIGAALSEIAASIGQAAVGAGQVSSNRPVPADAVAGGEPAAEPALNGAAPLAAAVQPASHDKPQPDNEPQPDDEPQPDNEPQPHDEPQPDEEPEPPAPAPRNRNILLWAAGTALGLVIVAVVLVLALGGGSGQRKPKAQTAAARATTTAPPVPIPQTGPAPSPTVSRPPTIPLAALHGGVVHARGSVFLAGDGRRRRLKLTVIRLPAAHRGHYEVWLYNSIIDSRPLGRLRNRVRHLTLRLPLGSRHYRWIDISFQPPGFRNHSGESVLRARDPARASRRQLRRRAARHRQLRRATNRSPSASSPK
jgi:hypothetical protein